MTVFVEVSEICTYKGGPIVKFAPDTHSTHMAWTSNAELVILRNCMLNTKHMKIEMPLGITCDQLQSIVLGILNLDRVDWLKINTLSITYPSLFCGHYVELVAIDEQIIADVKRAVQYFGQNMRSIAELNLKGPTNRNARDLIYASFVSTYGGQLQVLRVGAPVALGFSHLPKIKVLDLALSLTVAPVIPSVCGETLKVLKLNNVPRNFAWHYFRYDIYTRPIVFRRLTILHLSYDSDNNPATAANIHSRAASGAPNCDQLVFPVLKQLSIRNCTPDCDLLYAEAPFPELKSVHLSGLFNEISHCSHLKLSWVKDLHVDVHLSDTDEEAKVCNITNYFFSRVCIGRTATLRFSRGQFTLDPELIRWINLTRLEVHLIHYRALCRVIDRCPNITSVLISNLEFGADTVESLAADAFLFASADPLVPWGAKLTEFDIVSFGMERFCDAGAYGIQAFILNTGALMYLTVPEPVEPRIYAFISLFKESYPHLANIAVDSS
ncbi:hypothetical protein IWW57_000268 [Coemansia sp. S610]|nr:hypothetical protein IWW57_000268 [Coemansia sp. S610]